MQTEENSQSYQGNADSFFSECEYKVKKEFKFLFISNCPNIVVVACRGAGKTVAAIQSTVYRLFNGKANGSAIFFSPTLPQARGTVEGPMRMIISSLPEGLCQYNVSEHKYKFFMGPKDVRELLLLSYEDPETKRGYHPDTVVLDECASMPVGMFSVVIEPMLAPARSAGYGRLLAIGTPQGPNKFHELFLRGLDDSWTDWESYELKASETNLLDKNFLWRARNGMTSAEFNQEYECDFKANVIAGSVYGEFMDKFTKQNIDDSYSYDPSLPVWTAWDLGYTDNTSIWFFQAKNDLITFIDFFEDSGKDTSFYVNELLAKPYHYAKCILPWDGARKDMRGASISEQIERYGLRTECLSNSSEMDGIDEARRLLKVARFNRKNCEKGLIHLKSFKFKTDPRSKMRLKGTVHDQHSHAADAFRYAAMGKDTWNLRQINDNIRPVRSMDYDILY